MKDIVNAGFIISHQDEILKFGDIIPKCIFKYIPEYKIQEYFEYNKRNDNFCEEIETIEGWKNSEELMLFYPTADEIIELIEDWVECYPQFEGILNRDSFEEYLEKDGEVTIDEPDEILEIENRFHDLILQRARIIFEKYDIPMPKLTHELINTSDGFTREEFPVPGMYGGFYYFLTIENGEYVLYTDSWSRIAEGSGEAHRITKDECELIAEGFV